MKSKLNAALAATLIEKWAGPIKASGVSMD